ncbi:hypothetical protein PCANC_14458 [Puccinia coronata f. sp. avenae]|uniref:Uncharacterized protein n=1 Tax=Puccinia coronata f. sp. avenae TaxID=200324 RepID=A0A2N5USD7_9BASI|nr:hypothetical protein PCANC_14458 [Puccinia coronata f. sp. avenae]
MLSSLSPPTRSWTYSAARAIVFGESNQSLSAEESPGPPSRVQLATRAQGSHRGREPSTPHKTPLRRKPQKNLCLQEDGGAMESVGRVIRPPLGMADLPVGQGSSPADCPARQCRQAGYRYIALYRLPRCNCLQ